MQRPLQIDSPFNQVFGGAGSGLPALADLLFKNNEDGFLYGDFAEFDELFQTQGGPFRVAADNDPCGLVLDDHGWNGLTVAQVLATMPEMSNNGIVALLGAATVATYNQGTGVGTVTRVDAVNQSYVSFAGVIGGMYAIDITPASPVSIRSGPAGAVHVIAEALNGRRTYYVKADSAAAIVLTSTNPGTAAFTVHSVKFIPGSVAPQPNLVAAGAWAMSVAGGTSTAVEAPAGTLTLQSDGVNGARGDQSFPTVIGRVYRVDFTVATQAVTLLVGTAQGTQNILAVSPNVGTVSYQFVATTATTWVRLVRNAGGTTVVSNISVRLAPNNHGLQQATSANRATWKANAGKPALAFDGVSDTLISGFYPNATAGFAMAVAFNGPGTVTTASPIGGGTPTGNKRAFIALLATGALSLGWGEQINRSNVADLRNQNHVVIVEGQGATRTVWLDGVDITADFAASVGFADGTGGAMTIAGRQNTVGGAPDQFWAGNVSAALSINRRLTVQEIARINYDFQRTF